MSDQPDLFGAISARDEALARVSEHNLDWQTACFLKIPHCPFSEATGEQLRLWLLDVVGPPHHHNAWGALVKGAIGRGLLRRTGRRVKMRTRKSHARETDVYSIRRYHDA